MEKNKKNKRIKKDIGKSQKDDVMLSDPDFEEYMLSFEDSFNFPARAREGTFGPSSSDLILKRTTSYKGIDSFVPFVAPSSQPTLDAKWKKI